jgi:hypothetical protein
VNVRTPRVLEGDLQTCGSKDDDSGREKDEVEIVMDQHGAGTFQTIAENRSGPSQPDETEHSQWTQHRQRDHGEVKLVGLHETPSGGNEPHLHQVLDDEQCPDCVINTVEGRGHPTLQPDKQGDDEEGQPDDSRNRQGQVHRRGKPIVSLLLRTSKPFRHDHLPLSARQSGSVGRHRNARVDSW